MAVSTLLVLAALAASPNGAGYRIKGAVLLAAGAIFFLLAVSRIRGRTEALDPRAAQTLLAGLGYFSVFATVAILMLMLNFRDPVERATGAAAQLVAGAVGLYGCVRYIRSS